MRTVRWAHVVVAVATLTSVATSASGAPRRSGTGAPSSSARPASLTAAQTNTALANACSVARAGDVAWWAKFSDLNEASTSADLARAAEGARSTFQRFVKTLRAIPARPADAAQRDAFVDVVVSYDTTLRAVAERARRGQMVLALRMLDDGWQQAHDEGERLNAVAQKSGLRICTLFVIPDESSVPANDATPATTPITTVAPSTGAASGPPSSAPPSAPPALVQDTTSYPLTTDATFAAAIAVAPIASLPAFPQLLVGSYVPPTAENATLINDQMTRLSQYFLAWADRRVVRGDGRELGTVGFVLLRPEVARDPVQQRALLDRAMPGARYFEAINGFATYRRTDPSGDTIFAIRGNLQVFLTIPASPVPPELPAPTLARNLLSRLR
jgi:hypothetical protein